MDTNSRHKCVFSVGQIHSCVSECIRIVWKGAYCLPHGRLFIQINTDLSLIKSALTLVRCRFCYTALQSSEIDRLGYCRILHRFWSIITGKHFQRCWPLTNGIHICSVNSAQVGSIMLSTDVFVAASWANSCKSRVVVIWEAMSQTWHNKDSLWNRDNTLMPMKPLKVVFGLQF